MLELQLFQPGSFENYIVMAIGSVFLTVTSIGMLLGSDG
jgi:hypothetical protein